MADAGAVNGSDVDIKAQLFAPDGSKSGEAFAVNTVSSSGQHIPTVASQADGTFIVTWTDTSGSADDPSFGAIRAQIFGGYADEVLHGTDGADSLSGLAGNDTMYGNDGADTLSGRTGDDSIRRGSDEDTLNGDSGNDWIEGGLGDDTVNGGDGADRIMGNDGSNTNGDGDDTLSGGDGNNIVA